MRLTAVLFWLVLMLVVGVSTGYIVIAVRGA